MSTLNEPHPDSPAPEPVVEELVAYLDGELPPDECRQVEERLASDADYRQQLRDLDQAWEALDSLPATGAGDDFARTTIEMVTLAAQQDQQERSVVATTASRNRRRLWAAVGGIAVLLSFAGARLLMPNSNARLLADLPVIARMDFLAQIQDVDFLQRLSSDVPFDKLATDQAAVKREVANFAAASDQSAEARRQWIETLPAEQKADLAAQAEQFGKLPADERERLISLEHQIAAADDADQLQKTLAAYGQWLSRRTSGEQSRLRGLATDERIGRIRSTLRQENEQAARRLSEADAKALKQEIFEIYDEVKGKDDFARFMQRRDRDERSRRLDATPEEKALFAVSWVLWSNSHINDNAQQRILRGLSPEAQRHLELVRRRGGERGAKVRLWEWMRDAIQPEREAGEIERFFAEELDENQRERLLSLRKDEMEAELERLYLGSRFGLRGAEWLGTIGEAGRGPGQGRPGWRPDGPPPGGPEANRFDPGRRGPVPGRPPGPDGRRRRGPPPDEPQPPDAQQPI